MKRRTRRFITAIYAALLALLSLLPSGRLPTISSWSRLFSPDKLAHFGAYALFALLLSVCFFERGKAQAALIAFLLATGYGVLLECLQALAGTGRQFDPVDMVANSLGALCGIVAWWLLTQCINALRQRSEISE